MFVQKVKFSVNAKVAKAVSEDFLRLYNPHCLVRKPLQNGRVEISASVYGPFKKL